MTIDPILLIYLIFALIFLWICRYGLILVQLLRVTFHYPSYRPQPLSQVPANVREVFQRAIDLLAPWGFVESDYYLVDRLDSWGKHDVPPSWELLCHYPELNTYAKVAIRLPLEAVDLFEIDFLTQWDDGRWSMTLDNRAYGLMFKLPLAVVQDAYTRDAQAQWQSHLQHYWEEIDRDRQTSTVSPRELMAAYQGYQRAYAITLQESGKIVQKGEIWQLSWRTALVNTPRIGRGLSRAQRGLSRRRREVINVIPLPIELELESFRWMEDRQMRPLNRQTKLLLTGSSLVLFILSCINLLSWENIAILVGVLLLHEGGHLGAMKIRGYCHHSLLFLPWFGAVASAHKEDATTLDKTIVALAGPLPGLCLGLILAFGTERIHNPDWLNTAIDMTIALNAINLLPVYPLDGGQVADLLLFSRHPYSDLFFKLIGVGISLCLTKIHPIALFFVLAIALTIPASFRSARLDLELRRTLGRKAIERDLLLGQIFSLLNRSGGNKLSFSTRYRLSKKLLQRHREARTSMWTRWGLGLVYGLSLVCGLWGGKAALFPHTEGMELPVSRDTNHL
jgi:Zn-dependent protease